VSRGDRPRGRLAGLELAVVLVVLLAGTVPAPAGGLREMEDGWLIPLPHLARLIGGNDPDRRPRLAAEGSWFSSGQARLFGMPELPLYRIAAGRSGRGFQVEGSWQRLGGDLFREDRVRLKVGWGGGWRLLADGGWDRVRLGGEASRPEPAAAVGLVGPTLRPWVVRISWSLLPPPTWHGRRSQRRWLLAAGRFRGGWWAAAVDRSGTGEPSLQMAFVVRVRRGVGLGLRGDPATGSLGITTAVSGSAWLVRSSHLVHPDLGLTHRWSLTWGKLGGAW